MKNCPPSGSLKITKDMNHGCKTILQATPMEDSLFPYLGDNYSDILQSTAAAAAALRKQNYSLSDNEQSDLEADSMPESQMELTEVDVYTQLEHKERDLFLAAELGKSLLEKNESLMQENERISQEFNETIEALEQEKFELRQRLEFKSSECEASTVQLSSDIMRTQEELEERKAMLAASEREKSRAIEELAEQNRKLLAQLQLASDAEERLSAQVQQLRSEFLQRSTSADVKILQLETLQEEIQQGTERQTQLETNCDEMKDEAVELREDLAVASERIHHLERQLHDRERELKSVMVELNDSHLSNRQLQIRVDELREELSLQMSFASNGNSSSLLSELEQSGIHESEIFDFGAPVVNDSGLHDLASEANEIHEASSARDSVSHEAGNSTAVDDRVPEVTLRYYQALLNSVNNCHYQLFQLKQDMWDSYQRIQTICTCLRSFVQDRSQTPSEGSRRKEEDRELEEPQSPTAPANLAASLGELSTLVNEAIKTKVVNGQADGELLQMLKNKHEATTRERNEAVAAKNTAEVNLVRAKTDLMSVNSQLLEAIQQKLQQQREIEEWQEDMERMVQKNLNEKNSTAKANALKRAQAQIANPPQRSSWFNFGRSRQPSDGSTKSSLPSSGDVIAGNGDVSTRPGDLASPEPSTPVTSRFAAWLRRRQNTEQGSDAHSTDSLAS